LAFPAISAIFGIFLIFFMIFSEFFGYFQPIKKSGHVTVGKNYISISAPSKNDIYPWEKSGSCDRGKVIT